jgi:hypothetical protein
LLLKHEVIRPSKPAGSTDDRRITPQSTSSLVAAGMATLLRVQVVAADLFDPSAGHVPRWPTKAGREPLQKTMYVELTTGTCTQHTPAAVAVLGAPGVPARLRWGELLEFDAPAEGAQGLYQTGDLLTARLMERDLPPANNSGRATAPPLDFVAHAGHLTCPDLGRPGGAEQWGRGMLWFVLGKHTLRYYEKQELAATGGGSPHGFSLAKATAVGVSEKFNNCFELSFVDKPQPQLFIAETDAEAAAWVDRIGALLPTRHGTAKVVLDEGESGSQHQPGKRSLTWQHDTLVVHRLDLTIEAALGIASMARVGMVRRAARGACLAHAQPCNPSRRSG